MKSSTLVLALLLFAGCAAAPPKPPPAPEVRLIDEQTATKMVQRYLAQRMDRFGYSAPYDDGTAWVFRVSAGDVTPLESSNGALLLVDKRSGYISWGKKE